MADAPAVLTPEQQQSAVPSVSQPSSGTYGEQSSLDALKKSLPVGNVGNPGTPKPQAPPISQQGTTAPPSPQGRPPTGAAVPPGLPGVLAGPTQQPQTPVNTPLQPGQSGAPQPSGNPQQDRMSLLYMLQTHPGVSQDTKQWATNLLNILTRQ